jgi:hypothetical protein
MSSNCASSSTATFFGSALSTDRAEPELGKMAQRRCPRGRYRLGATPQIDRLDKLALASDADRQSLAGGWGGPALSHSASC